MGLTVKYGLSYPVTSQDVVEKMEGVRQKCLDLPFAKVSTVDHILISKEDVLFFRGLIKRFMYPNNTEENLELRDKMLRDRGLDTWTMICLDDWNEVREHEIVQLKLLAGRGCEPILILLEKKGEEWQGRGFTKTQYAEEFVQSHLLVIKAMDLLEEAGFTVDVTDEGHYYETRNLEVLAQNINNYTGLVKSLFGALKEAAEKLPNSISVESPIAQCENYVKVRDKKTE